VNWGVKAGIIAGVLIVGSLATGAFYYYDVRKDQGEPLRSLDLPKACQAVSPQTIEQDPGDQGGKWLFGIRAQAMTYLPSGYEKRVDGVGDEAEAVVSPNGPERLIVEYLVRKGDTVVNDLLRRL
jgi:hypothetical protein